MIFDAGIIVLLLENCYNVNYVSVHTIFQLNDYGAGLTYEKH